jgi:olefin beta-lactone synthetase
LQAITGVAIATVIKVNEALIAIVEINENGNKAIITEAIHALGIEKISYLSKIPRDQRHYSKIDYEKLKQMNF